MAHPKAAVQASHSQRPAGSCLCWRRHNKVIPDVQQHEDWKLIEIRPGRFLRVIHLNPKPRDEKFAKEMQMFSFYQKQSLSCNSNNAVVSSGPLSMPPKKNQAKGQSQSQHPTTPPKINYVRKSSAQVSSNPQGGSSNELNLSLEASSLQSSGVHSASSVIVGIATLDDGGEGITTKDVQRPATPLVDGKDNVPLRPTSAKLGSADDLDVAKVEEEILEGRPKTPAHCAPAADKGTVLFFIHGVGGSADVWKAQMNYFGDKGYEVVALDLIGHGYSSAPRNARAYHFDEIVVDTTELFDTFCKRRNVIIGHSYGCSFASVLARRRSRRVTKLVMISGGAPTPLSPQPGVFSLPICLLACFRPCVECRYKKSAFSSKRRPIIPAEDAFNVPTYVLRHTMNGQNWPDGDEFFHNWLMCPTLLIYGLKDELISLADEQEMAETIYQSQLEVIEDASHMVMIEAPKEVNQLLEKFLQENQQQGSILELHDHSLDRSRPSLRAKSAKSIMSFESSATANNRVLSPVSVKSPRQSQSRRSTIRR